MSRTALLKILYVVAIIAVLGIVFAVAEGLPKERRSAGLMLMGLFAFIPGRIQGFFYRRFFRGRRLLDSGRPAEALEEFQAFLAQLAVWPARKRLVWLSWTFYSTDIEAMTWNNIGAAHMGLQRWPEALEDFTRALGLDAKYSIAHVNLARLAIIEGDRPRAEHHLADARRLGYRATSVDALAQEMQALLARVEGR